ncbi:hypothetical protein NM208_g3422 [Fusarium decemcellulare]|uniref:Uncharacterized protein n=2 Tax=Fusarium decemcellulare TaxID=57161 RepID=A0ACC1SP92_9HYPO|nr:hypothetical protein NM208_g3422 [Fusarium decemcellulare]
MENSKLYRLALERVTQPDVKRDAGLADDIYDVPPVAGEDRAGCERWFEQICFLSPGRDNETWENIKRNWIAYISATSDHPDSTLAPDGKTVWGAGTNGESERHKRQRFRADREERRKIQITFWNELDCLEGLTERWPRAARVVLNHMDPEQNQGAFQSLAAIWDLSKRRRYQAILTSLFGFLVYSMGQGTLEEMGLYLDEDDAESLFEIITISVMHDMRGLETKSPKFRLIWRAIESFLLAMMDKEDTLPDNNPLIWWMAILVRSALSADGPDFISRGRFDRNILPMDVDVRERLEAMRHYFKVIVLGHAFWSWESQQRLRVQTELDIVNNLWLNDENGCRPFESRDLRDCSTPEWQAMIARVWHEVYRMLGGRRGSAVWWMNMLEKEMSGVKGLVYWT